MEEGIAHSPEGVLSTARTSRETDEDGAKGAEQREAALNPFCLHNALVSDSSMLSQALISLQSP